MEIHIRKTGRVRIILDPKDHDEPILAAEMVFNNVLPNVRTNADRVHWCRIVAILICHEYQHRR